MDTSKINSKKTAAKSSTARSIRKDNRTIPAPADESPYVQLDKADRKTTHYVLVSGGKYLSDLDGTLTDKLSEAMVDTSYGQMHALADIANKYLVPKKLKKRCKVEYLYIEPNGRATCSRPMGTADDDPILSRSMGNDWTSHGGAINSALAEAAAVEKADSDDDTICATLSEMSFSPMFRLLVEDFQASMKKTEGMETDWYLTMFAARNYVAGKIAGRREAAAPQNGGAR